MSTLLYLHGFLSSPQSDKAVQAKNWVEKNRQDIKFICPSLSPYFNETRVKLESLIESAESTPIYLMGSSLGGYYATYLAEKYNLKAALINPLVDPHVLDGDSYIGAELKNYHTDDIYILEEHHADELLSLNTPSIKRHENYYLLVQTGDESLDYKLAVEKYKYSKQYVEEGGDHSFQGFEKHMPEVIAFLTDKQFIFLCDREVSYPWRYNGYFPRDGDKLVLPLSFNLILKSQTRI
jgi:predicted esterase YcpF (UPF0227 family)